MNTSNDYLNAIKAKTGAASDYQLAKILNLTRGGISSYRHGRTYFDESTCLKVASLLDIPAFEVLLSVQAERSKNKEAKAAYKSLFEKLGGVAASAVLGLGLISQSPEIKAAEPASFVNDVYYVKSKRRNKRFINPLESLVFQLLAI